MIDLFSLAALMNAPADDAASTATTQAGAPAGQAGPEANPTQGRDVTARGMMSRQGEGDTLANGPTRAADLPVDHAAAKGVTFSPDIFQAVPGALASGGAAARFSPTTKSGAILLPGTGAIVSQGWSSGIRGSAALPGRPP